jgi:hypothetical protein
MPYPEEGARYLGNPQTPAPSIYHNAQNFVSTSAPTESVGKQLARAHAYVQMAHIQLDRIHSLLFAQGLIQPSKSPETAQHPGDIAGLSTELASYADSLNGRLSDIIQRLE